MNEQPNDMQMEPLKRLTRDLKQAAATLSPDEARFLVDSYYQLQEDRIRSAHQVRTLKESGEPHSVLAWFGDNAAIIERNIKSALDVYSDNDPVGKWAKSITGIGPIIAAGLLAHIDIAKAPTAGHIWRFAGLDSSVQWQSDAVTSAALTALLDGRTLDEPLVYEVAQKWGRQPASLLRTATTEHKTGKKVELTQARLSRALARRPWNATLKTLTWKIGQSFMKFSGHEKDVYGKLYLQRKAVEIQRNDAGDLAQQAKEKLERFRIGKGTDAWKSYSVGKLPPAHIDARARRWAVKLFLSHYQEAAYFSRFGTLPPKPYVLEHLGHAHVVRPPNMDVVDGWDQARTRAGI